MKANHYINHRLSVAPMMDWTDRHCRFFHRVLVPDAMLYTEMITADAIRFGKRDVLLGGHQQGGGDAHIVLQLGGACPESLAEAVRLAEPYEYAEYNLNVGCPSSRVQSGRFGAALMAEPQLVAELVAAMKSATAKPISVKCRIGIDDMPIDAGLDAFAEAVIGGAAVGGGVDHLIIHARQAWLKGLSPKENRAVPPLNYARVYQLKADFPAVPMSINGGFADGASIADALEKMDGVMVGRAAYQFPSYLRAWGEAVFANPAPNPDAIMAKMADYADAEVAKGARLIAITRHILGFAHGLAGARQWRRLLSEEAREADANGDLIREAWAMLTAHQQRKAA